MGFGRPGFSKGRKKKDKKFGQAELTGCPFMSAVEIHWLEVTPSCQSQKAFRVSVCGMLPAIAGQGRKMGFHERLLRFPLSRYHFFLS